MVIEILVPGEGGSRTFGDGGLGDWGTGGLGDWELMERIISSHLPTPNCLEKVLHLRLTFWTGSPSKKVRQDRGTPRPHFSLPTPNSQLRTPQLLNYKSIKAADRI